jgi:hypothetical protein
MPLCSLVVTQNGLQYSICHFLPRYTLWSLVGSLHRVLLFVVALFVPALSPLCFCPPDASSSHQLVSMPCASTSCPHAFFLSAACPHVFFPTIDCPRSSWCELVPPMESSAEIVSAFRTRGSLDRRVKSLRAPAQMGWRGMEHKRWDKPCIILHQGCRS